MLRAGKLHQAWTALARCRVPWTGRGWPLCTPSAGRTPRTFHARRVRDVRASVNAAWTVSPHSSQLKSDVIDTDVLVRAGVGVEARSGLMRSVRSMTLDEDEGLRIAAPA
jgi:hypothetical protein